ncbi:MAG: tRNA epoxyqueuosine(34) reductase QueG [Rhizobiales bacterium]|nr:tRNA epoxyqueuosine(34) reductase QueG [Hyphomicrobiales bacterium]
MPSSISETAKKALARLRQAAVREGLPLLRVTEARLPPTVAERLQTFLDAGHAGDMAWMAETAERRASPEAMWSEARTAIVFAQPYTPAIDPLSRLDDTSAGVISVYALNRDYHEVFKGKLKQLAQVFAATAGAEVKVFVDTAPLMEKPLAAQAGLGWQGKHSNLVSREAGNWFFIGTILTTVPLPSDTAEEDHCGTCRSCLDICPTRAFPAPYRLDARRCISYLTIEHTDHIAREFRKPMGNRIYGCDDCLAVCPWNKFAQACNEAKLVARDDLVAPRLADLLALDDASFRQLFSGSPVKRVGRERFLRNCLIAAGNSGDAALIPIIAARLADASPLVRAMAVWAHAQLAEGAVHDQLRARYLPLENDAGVREEWQAA